MSAITNVSDHLLAVGRPDQVALVDGPKRHTYRDLRNAVARVASRLDALGLPPGSRVGVLGPNSLFWVAAYLAAMRRGHVAVPLSDKLTAADIRRNLELSACSVVCLDPRSRRLLPDRLEGGPAVISDEVLSTDGGSSGVDSVTMDPDADAVLMFTSGTTARPKLVRVTHRNIQANTESIITYLGLRSDDRILVILPFHYCYGASLLHTHLRVGARLVLCNSFVFPETALDLLDREGCTEFAGVPSSFQLLLRAGSLASRALPSLRLIQAAGGALPPVIVDELLRAKPAARLFVMYGQTEATARLSYLPPERLADKRGSIGRGIPGVDLSVLDDAGRPVPPGVRGEIYARGENVSPGYLGDPEATADRFTPWGLRTGDLAVVDDDGFISVVDRRDDFIKSWGHRISSQEVEAGALRLPEIVAAAAVGVPDPAAGEAVTLFVTVRAGAALTGEQILAFCGRTLPRHMVPKAVVILDGLPLTASGKVAKAELRTLGASS
ncbi:MAG TPA: AMP-binding protein [Kineosporiaceae bacterium]